MVVVVVSLSVSPFVALGSLVYLVAIHKLEYFLNARLVGTRIEARAWELLLAMLLMEAVFGVAGLIAAPIYYAYLKDELTAKGLGLGRRGGRRRAGACEARNPPRIERGLDVATRLESTSCASRKTL